MIIPTFLFEKILEKSNMSSGTLLLELNLVTKSFDIKHG